MVPRANRIALDIITFFIYRREVLKVIEEFLEYVSNYDETRDRVRFKKEHTLRVRSLAMQIAQKSGFTEEEVELAGIIGLLHDIGRFEQDRLYESFTDAKTMDHAEYGADLLFKESLISKYTERREWYPAIEYAIRNHNKLSLVPNEDELSYKMGKLIRDADKIDIIYLLGVLGNYDEKSDDSEISPSVVKCFDERRCVDSRDVKTKNDKIASTMAFAFDINYDASLDFIRKYLIAYYERVEQNDKFKSLFEKAIEYLDERIEKIC